MALGWVLFIKILLLLLALCPASIPVVGGKEEQAGRLSPAPSAISERGLQLLLQQGDGDHEAAPQEQSQPLQQHLEHREGLRRTQQGWQLKKKNDRILPSSLSRKHKA